jgi:hypothetical protein
MTRRAEASATVDQVTACALDDNLARCSRSVLTLARAGQSGSALAGDRLTWPSSGAVACNRPAETNAAGRMNKRGE